MSLTSFARNPRKALRRLSAEGLVLTRPGEPPLRVTLADPNSASDLPDSAVPDAVEDESGEPSDLGTDIGQAALRLLPSAQFLALVCARTPWLDDVPPAVLRMVLTDVEAARTASGGSLDAVDDVLRGWHHRSAAFFR